MSRRMLASVILGTLVTGGCWIEPKPDAGAAAMEARVAKYTTVRLTADFGALTERERQVVSLLIDAAEVMDELFWLQSYGQRSELLRDGMNRHERDFIMINYGPWDRLAGNEVFVRGARPRPEGANFYPTDMTREEFELAAALDPALRSPYTLVRRGEDGRLVAVPYHVAYAPQLERAAAKLREAATYADNAGLRRYLELRADALLTDDYRASDMAWMDVRDNSIDVIVGPIEKYEDQLFGFKAAYSAQVLLKDREWSARLARYATLLPELQRGLPVEERYRSETPGADSDLNAYDVVYYAGDANAGAKSIAVNLPNDEEVQLARGTRRLQLRNSMRAKFDAILVPIAELLIAPEQRHHVTFDAFFSNVMFHEAAHGLGIKYLVDGSGTVRDALREQASALEEGKADVLGLYMVTALHDRSALGDAPLDDYYVTFMAGIFRSVRFGAASAHGRANMACFNFFAEHGAFEHDAASGTYRVIVPRMREAMNALSARILTFQGDGDHAGVVRFMEEYGRVPPSLAQELTRVNAAGIPVDIVLEQGRSVLGL
jgi:hypothetical protein